MKCPENYLAEMKELFREDYDAYLRSFDDAPSSGLRINTAKISTEDFLSLAPFHLTPVPWTSNGFYYAKEDDPARHPFYHAGLYYIQEPSAMCPASILPVRENDVVLDACAAPGG
ncbi:MAG: SAM-dependent methyltransferase, partial [Erysipelotrichales bacterium]|nr:SAM-dependent methyltransferase [Erysipelotrichales bacterium]